MRLFTPTLTQKRNLAGSLFILPWLVGFVTLLLVPLAQSFAFSLSKLHVTAGGYMLENVGGKNYAYILAAHPDFVRTVTGSVLTMLADVPLILVFSVFAALLVRRRFRGRTLARIVLFLPVIISSGVVLRLQDQGWMRDLLQAQTGGETAGIGLRSVALRAALLEWGFGKELVLYVTDAVNRIHEIIGRSGVQILLSLAGLHAIPDSFYEAARMEGASGWEIFWKITFPSVTPVLLASAVYTIIDSFTSFDNATMEMVRVTAFGQSQYGQSAAMSWVYFAMIAAVIVAVFAAVSRRVFYRE